MEVPTVVQVRSWAGLDVHAAKVVAAVVDGESGELRVRRLGGNIDAVASFLAGFPGPVRATYEAGPTGFGLARALERAGVDCVIAAPGKIPIAPTDRVKTDRRDAEKLVRLLMAGALSAVRVPTLGEEALRDLVRAREDLRLDLNRARHRLLKLLLRHGLRFEAGKNWTVRHRQWLAQVRLGEPAAQAALHDYLGAVDALVVRRGALEGAIEELVPSSPWADEVARLRCMRGVNTLTAIGLCAEVGDWARFHRPAQVMSYLGLVPSEQSSGEQRRQGSITKSGSQHGRRLLVEAAWHYRREPHLGAPLRRRQTGQPAHVVALAWKAQRRGYRTWRRLHTQRAKRATLVNIAVARELAGFCWAIATAD
jgi:transposase